jgi:ABC-type dipeptide/oligopeptide/nickel transport system permease subunit
VPDRATVDFVATDVPPWRTVLRRVVRRPSLLGAIAVLALVTLGAFAGAPVWRFGYATLTDDLDAPPSGRHPLGTDALGHDELAVVLRGAQQSLKIAFCVVLIGVVVGAVWGTAAAHAGGLVDAVLMRSADVALALPVLVVVAAIAHNRSGSWAWIAVLLGLASAPHIARVARAAALSVQQEEFVLAAIGMGAGPVRIVGQYLLPNIAPVLIVNGALLAASSLLAETGLSFLGFGVRPPDTSLGLQVARATDAARTQPWLFYFPGLTIVLIAVAVNLIGDGMQAVLDPRQ